MQAPKAERRRRVPLCRESSVDKLFCMQPRRESMKKLLLLGALIALAGSALAQEAMKAATVTPDALVWKDNPALPKGAQVAILVGDPTKAGEVVVQRVKLPANYQVPPHTHPYAETVTLLSGSAGFGMGEKSDKGGLSKPGTLF